jgi:hypothetical protein
MELADPPSKSPTDPSYYCDIEKAVVAQKRAVEILMNGNGS